MMVNQMPKKLGQHFLKDTAALKKIAAALEIEPGDTIIEIGAGGGELTEKLKTENEKVKILAIEKDPRLAEKLRQRFAENKNIKVIEGDAIQVLPALLAPRFKIAGNIPYYLTGHLLRTIGELKPKPVVCVFTLQKEVAERLAAAPPRMNRLAASVQFWAEPKILGVLPKTIFHPQPKVDSAIVILKTKRPPEGAKPDDYYKTVRILFRQPRKTLLNNLLQAGRRQARTQKGKYPEREEIAAILRRLNLDPNLRPQDLEIADILRIGDDFRKL
jgi:16S rRNA (adenine1518-N6/adenine1519-N6)-dimethyltransferase